MYSYNLSKRQYRIRYSRHEITTDCVGPSRGRLRCTASLCIQPAVAILHIWLTGISIIRPKGKAPELLKDGDFWCSSAEREYRPPSELLHCSCYAPDAHGTLAGARPTPRGRLRPSLSPVTLSLPANLIIGSASGLSIADGLSVAQARQESWSTFTSRTGGCRWCAASTHSRCASHGPRAHSDGDVGVLYALHTVSAACLACLLRV